MVWHTRGPVGWERPIISLLRRGRLPIERPLVLLWEPLPFALATAMLTWAALGRRRVQLAISGIAGCAAAMVVTERVLKPLLDRHLAHSGAPVFPSGHVTAAAAWAMFAWLLADERSQIRSALVLVPLVAAWAVVSEGDHLPADAVVGLLVGGLVVYGVVVGTDRLVTSMSTRLSRRAATAFIERAPADDRVSALT